METLKLPELGAELPVYPDGSVTLTLPVTHTGATQAQVVVSYGACSAGTCLAPVSDEAIALDLR